MITLSNIGLIPEIFLSISIIYLLIFGSIISTYKTYPLIQNLILNLSILILFFCLLLVLNDQLWIKEVLSFNNTIVNDYLSFVSKIFILVFSIVCMVAIQNYIKDQKINQFEYSIIILLSILGFMILCSSNDLVTAYLAIELQSLSFYVMACFKKNSSFSVEAGLKYFILGSFSSSILLFGSSLLYCVTGSLNFEDYRDLYFHTFVEKNSLLPDVDYFENKFVFSNFTVSYGEYLLLSNSNNPLSFMEFKELYDCFNIDPLQKYYNVYSDNSDGKMDLQTFKEVLIHLDSNELNDFYKTYVRDLPLHSALDEITLSNIKFYSKFSACASCLSCGQSVSTTESLTRLDYQDFITFLVNLELLNHFFVSGLDVKIRTLLFTNSVNYFSKLNTNGSTDCASNNLSDSEVFLKYKLDTKFQHINDNLLDQLSEIFDLASKKEFIMCKICSLPDPVLYNSISTMCQESSKMNLNFIHDLHIGSSSLNSYNDFVLLGLMLIFTSLMFKLALAPVHAWSPDVYEGSPTSSTLFFAVVSKLSILVLLIRIFYHSFHGLIYCWKFYIIFISLLSVLVGSFAAIENRKLKSLFAYSSVSHLGYIFIAFCSGTLEGIQSLIAYIFIYMLTSSCVWSILILLKPKNLNNNKANKDLADVASLIKSNSVLGIIFSTTLFSMAGFPPLIGFFTKFNIFLTALESSMYFVAILSILSSVVSTFYYIRIIKVICFENKLVGRLYHPLPYLSTMLVVLNFFLIIFLFINPTLLYLISHKISLLYFY